MTPFCQRRPAAVDARDIWVLDPIDGTSNFARGIAHFAISLAFCRDGATELGIVYDIVGNELFSARRGQGARCNDTPIHASNVVDRCAALVDAGYSDRHPIGEYIELVDRLVSAGYGFCQGGSAALGLAYVACGRLEAFCEIHLFSWDVLAGLLLVREAGGWTSEPPYQTDLNAVRTVLACAATLAPDLRAVTGF